MRLWYMKLVNYIGIYNGMGITSISIDFSKCKNAITVIKGDNGSGKSTLFKAMNPFSDSFSSLIPGKEARKYIAYRMNDGQIIHIQYTYPVNSRGDRKPTTCSIQLQPNPETNEKIQLNGNFNVNEGKATICRLMDIDSGFLTLAQLSSDDRGLADKTPVERKKFINKKISELDAYNEIFKKLTKKSTELKGTVQSLSNKISAIGDIRSIKQNLEIAENNLARLEENKLSLVAEMSQNKTRYDDIIAKYNDPVKQHRELSDEISGLQNQVLGIGSYDPENANRMEDAVSYTAKIQYNTEKLSDIDSQIEKAIQQKYQLSDTLTTKQVSLDSLGDAELLQQLQHRKQSLEQDKANYLVTLQNFPEQVLQLTEEEYDYAVKAAIDISSMVEKVKEEYSFDTINESVTSYGSFVESKHTYSASEIDSLRKAISHYDELIQRENYLQEQSSSYDQIPLDCPHKTTCPFVMNITKAKKDMKNKFEYNQLVANKEHYESLLKETESGYEKQQTLSACKNDLNMILSATKLYKKYLLLFGTEIHMENDMMILRSILGYSQIIDPVQYHDYRNTFIQLKAAEKDISEIDKKLDSIQSGSALADMLKNDIVSLKNQIQDIDIQIDTLSNQKDSLIKENEKLDAESKQIRSDYEKSQQHMALQSQIEEKQKELQAIDEAYSKAMEYDKKLNELQEKVDSLFIDIKTTKRTIEENKYKTTLYQDYTTEYAKYTKEFDKYETIRYYCSPTTGIQTVFMEMYMNSVIGISNQLLSMFFGGEFVLQPFVVNEKEFRMPVLGSGILNDDISSMSTSQICMISMILSFALLHQSSSIYNIIKLDELEGGLDTQNRLNFFGVLSTLMNQLHFEQCIMISHNAELNMNNMDVIILKNSDPDFVMEGNIIFNLQEVQHV